MTGSNPLTPTDTQDTMAAPQHILEWLSETDCEAMRLEPADLYDEHIVGVAYRFNTGPILVYDMKSILRSHTKMGMTRDEAEEFFEYNTLGAWVGEGTPVFLDMSPGSEE